MLSYFLQKILFQVMNVLLCGFVLWALAGYNSGNKFILSYFTGTTNLQKCRESIVMVQNKKTFASSSIIHFLYAQKYTKQDFF